MQFGSTVPIIERQSIIEYIIYFVLYLAGHIALGIYRNRYIDKGKGYEKQAELLIGLFTWFPFIYVVFILFFLLVVK